MNGRRGEDELAVLIKRSAELKRELVDFACSPRLERSLAAAMAEADREELESADAIDVINQAANKLAGLSSDGQLDRIVRAAPGRRRS